MKFLIILITLLLSLNLFSNNISFIKALCEGPSHVSDVQERPRIEIFTVKILENEKVTVRRHTEWSYNP